jgi:hypothetical protein
LLNIWSVIIGLFMVAVGLTGIVAPTDLVTIAQNSTTPAAAYVLAALLIVIGVVLIRASRTAGIPIVIQVVGILAVIGALVVPIFGARLVEWWAAQGPQVIRLTSLVKMAVGAVVVFAANP